VTGRLRIETADIASAEFLHKDLPYRSTDFEQIGLINTSPMILVARSVTEADAGVGSISNLACAVFHSVADVHPTAASYRGTPQRPWTCSPALSIRLQSDRQHRSTRERG
jgi:hypothetical protein